MLVSLHFFHRLKIVWTFVHIGHCNYSDLAFRCSVENCPIQPISLQSKDYLWFSFSSLFFTTKSVVVVTNIDPMAGPKSAFWPRLQSQTHSYFAWKTWQGSVTGYQREQTEQRYWNTMKREGLNCDWFSFSSGWLRRMRKFKLFGLIWQSTEKQNQHVMQFKITFGTHL